MVDARPIALLLLLVALIAAQDPWNLEDDYTTSTAAGLNYPGFTDGSLENATLSRPEAVAIDTVAQVLYVADRSNHAIRRIRVGALLQAEEEESNVVVAQNDTAPAVPPAQPPAPPAGPGAPVAPPSAAGASATTVTDANATGAANDTGTTRRLSEAASTDAAANQASRYSSDYVTTLAGGGVRGYADGYGVAARFDSPSGVAVDGYTGLLFVADTGNAVIRGVNLASGRVTTLAGAPGVRGFINGRGRAAAFNHPVSVALAPRSRQLYICDQYNYAIRVVHVGTREVRTLAGSGVQGSADGPGYIATFHLPAAAAVDEDEATLYVVDGSARIRMMPTMLEPTYWPDGAPPPLGTVAPSPPPASNISDSTPSPPPGASAADGTATTGRRLQTAAIDPTDNTGATGLADSFNSTNATDLNISSPSPPMPPLSPPSLPPAPGFGDVTFTTGVSTLFDGASLGLQELGGISAAYGWPGGSLVIADARRNTIYRLGLDIMPSPPPPSLISVSAGNGTTLGGGGNGTATGGGGASVGNTSSTADGGTTAAGRRLQLWSEGTAADTPSARRLSSEANATNATGLLDANATLVNATLLNATLLNATDSNATLTNGTDAAGGDGGADGEPSCSAVTDENSTVPVCPPSAPPPPSTLGCDADPPGAHCIVCAQGVTFAPPPYECHPLLVLLAGATPGWLDGMGDRARFYRPTSMSVDATMRRVYIADSYNHRVRVLDLTDVPDEVTIDVETWYEFIGRALRQNFIFIIILCGSSVLLCVVMYLMCRFCVFCPLYQKKLHQKRMDSMKIGSRGGFI